MDLKDEEKIANLETRLNGLSKSVEYNTKSIRLQAWSILANCVSVIILGFTILQLKH